MKIRPVGAELFRADGRTDMTNQIAAMLRTHLTLRNNPENCNMAVRP
jgi:hypothetical protein